MIIIKKVLVLLIACVVFYLSLTLYIFYYGQNSISKHSENRDVAIVLGAAVWDDKPSPVFEQRIIHAINLYKNKKINYIIFTGGKKQGDLYSESEIAQFYAIKNGVLKEDILLEKTSKITQENLSYTKPIIKKMNLKTAYIVSDPPHMLRAITMAKDLKINALPSPTSTSMYKSFKNLSLFTIRESFFYIGYIVSKVFTN